MQFFVYYLHSEKIDRFYIGQTDALDFRLWEHNTGQEISTHAGIPWKLVGYLVCTSRSEAVRLELTLKKAKNKKYVLWYVQKHGILA